MAQVDLYGASLRTERSKDEKGLGFIRVRTESVKDEQWRYSLRPAKGQHLEYRDVSSTEFEVRLVNDPGAEGVEPREASGKKLNRQYTEMDAAELTTLIAERNLPEPPATSRVGDLIKMLQLDDAKLERMGQKR